MLTTRALVRHSRLAFCPPIRCSSTLPVVSVAPFLSPATDSEAVAAREREALKLNSALQTVGFFYLDGHGVPQELLDGIRDQSRSFFAEPEHVKAPFAMKPGTGRGYQPLLQNITQGKPDKHQALDLICEVDDAHPLIQEWLPSQPDNAVRLEQARVLLTNKNLMPTATHPELCATIEEYSAAMLRLGPAVVRMMSHAFGFEEEAGCPFQNVSRDSYWVMRLIHYPAPAPAPAPPASSTASSGTGGSGGSGSVGQGSVADGVEGEDEDGIGCGAHTDYGLLTFLNQDPGIEALQVENRDGDWINAMPPPGALIVNIGDMTNNMTSGIYKSTNHRVIHNGNVDRISVPFFYECNFDALIKPVGSVEQQKMGIETHGANHEEVCYGWHLVQKINSNFVY